MTNIPRFVKWAGGKVQLIEQFKPLFPKKINRYFEPFVGSAAVAFYIFQEYKPKEIILSDINEELINVYNIVKSDVNALIKRLKQHKKKHMQNKKEYYYSIRSKIPKSAVNKAARFIYLNKTCFNGLYRVNSKGGFNVPIGSYKNPDIVQEEKLKVISGLLQSVTIKVMHFKDIVKHAKKNDFIYFDPPYHPLNNTKSFTTYTKRDFKEGDQKLLADIFKKLHEKGCKCMLSNSNTKFIKELYSSYKIDIVQARRMINSKASGRGKISEVVVRNY